MLHQLLTMCIAGCTVCTALSAAHPSSFVLALGMRLHISKVYIDYLPECAMHCGFPAKFVPLFACIYVTSTGKPYFTIMQGLWFIAIADIEYGNPEETFWPWGLKKHWDMESMANLMFLPMLFAWYLLLVFVIIIGMKSIEPSGTIRRGR